MLDLIGRKYKEHIGPHLRNHGWIEMRSSYIAQNNEIVHELAMERCRFNTHDRKQFKLILKMYVATEVRKKFTLKDWNHFYTLVFRKYIGYLWSNKRYMYILSDIEDWEKVFVQLKKHLSEYVFPLTRSLDSLDKLVTYLKGEHQRLGMNFFSYTLAIALARYGRLEESKAFFLESMGDVDVIEKTARNFGISLD